MPDDLPLIKHDDVLRYEETLRICRAAVKSGIKNIKVTGGEPLARKGCVGFLRDLKSIPGIEHVTLTTNGILLAPYIDKMNEIGLDGVNISLDTLNPDKYRQLTGGGDFFAVWASLTKAVEAGLRVKVNCVAIIGQNDDEIADIAKLAEQMPVDVRFIEFMPTGVDTGFEGLPGDDILSRVREVYPDLSGDPTRRGFGPARYFKSEKMRGSIGLIDAIGDCFCPGCNRVRLTSEGFLKLCLFHEDGLDLREMLRAGANDGEIEAAFKAAVTHKPERHAFAGSGHGIKNMSRIGG